MPSPFPGMNPYFENADVWESFHRGLMRKLRDRLADLAGDSYSVNVETRVNLHELSEEVRTSIPRTETADEYSSRYPSGSATVAAADPPTHRLQASSSYRAHEEPYLEIRCAMDRRVVTRIEMLTSENKAIGPDRSVYAAERLRMIRSNVHFVEIDLRRGGRRMQPDIVGGDYAALLKRTEAWPALEVWTWRLRERMPRVPVPVSAPDTDLVLDLNAVLDEVHDRGGYAHHLYRKPPEPRLSPEDQAWAEALLAAQPGAR